MIRGIYPKSRKTPIARPENFSISHIDVPSIPQYHIPLLLLLAILPFDFILKLGLTFNRTDFLPINSLIRVSARLLFGDSRCLNLNLSTILLPNPLIPSLQQTNIPPAPPLTPLGRIPRQRNAILKAPLVLLILRIRLRKVLEVGLRSPVNGPVLSLIPIVRERLREWSMRWPGSLNVWGRGPVRPAWRSEFGRCGDGDG
ncbi:hypothetical protein K491DRAFT_325339 [Lophiostoma macrostomum CBS 122681]|uniref:Uncharacterized protein n=1 Tax=Lophiostoma macrostomum CBS 122681 TaxID=1314788 RepID=A0A6A6TC67_9PLEO|nr:hypothetical protein K491DRAFT_325339 [Lophiostoma macrostomum CBS 122681]